MSVVAFCSLAPDLDEADQEALAAWGEILEFEDRAEVGADDECDTALYTVLDGTVRSLLEARESTLELAELEPGAMFGLDAFLDGKPSASRPVVAGRTRVLRIDRKRFEEEWAREAPATAARLYLALARNLAARLHAASCVEIENIDDDVELEVTSCLECLGGLGARAAQPFSSMSLTAYQTGTHALGESERMRAVELAAAMLQPLGHELYHGLGERMDLRKWSAGSEIVRAGSQPDGLYLVLEGRVHVHAHGQGPIRAERHLEASHVFGQEAFLVHAPHTATCVAESPVTAGIVGAHAVQGLLRYAAQGRPAGAIGLAWIARQTAGDWRRVLSFLAQAA